MSTYPPDGWTMGYGAWGTDANIDMNVKLTGDASLVLLDTTPGGDTYLYSDLVPIEPKQPLLVQGWLQVNSIYFTALNTISAYWYDSAGSYLSSSPVFHAVATATSTWELKSGIVEAPASAAYFRLIVAKANVGYKAWWDSVLASRFPMSCRAWLSTASQVLGGSHVRVGINDTSGSGAFNFGGAFDGSGHKFTAQKTGLHLAAGQISLTDLSNNTWVQASLESNASITYAKGEKETNTSGSAAAATSLISAQILYLQKGDTVELWGSTSASSPHLATGLFNTWLSVVEFP